MEEKELYRQWKETAKYSPEYTQRLQEEEKFKTSADKFFAASESQPLRAPPAKEDLGKTYLKQFKMDVKTPELANPYSDPTATKLTTNAFNELIMGQSLKKMSETTGMPPKLTTASYEERLKKIEEGT